MNFKKRFFFLAAILLMLLIVGCQAKEGPSDTKPKEDAKAETPSKPENQKKEERTLSLEAPPLPQTIEEIVEYPVGKLSYDSASLNDEAKAELETIDPLSEDAEQAELDKLHTYLYSLVKMEYDDPVELMERLGNPKEEGAPPEEQGSYNVIIALDASGSMANMVGSKTRMDLAKEAIESFASSLPKEANVGLRVYGHKGSGSSADKAMSCAANEVVYPITPYNQENLKQSLAGFKPAGWTPLAGAIEGAMKDLEPYKGEQNKNVVYVVSDGVETCDGNPVAEAAKLKESGISPVVHIIGFDVPNNEQQQLKDVADAAGGTYTNAKNHDQLKKEFEKTIQDSYEWLKWYFEEAMESKEHYYDQWREITTYVNSWHPKQQSEEFKIDYALTELRDQKKLTSEQTDYLKKKNKEYFKEIENKLNQFSKALNQANDDSLADTMAELKRIKKEKVK